MSDFFTMSTKYLCCLSAHLGYFFTLPPFQYSMDVISGWPLPYVVTRTRFRSLPSHARRRRDGPLRPRGGSLPHGFARQAEISLTIICFAASRSFSRQTEECFILLIDVSFFPAKLITFFLVAQKKVANCEHLTSLCSKLWI